jgi:hypothetical protein
MELDIQRCAPTALLLQTDLVHVRLGEDEKLSRERSQMQEEHIGADLQELANSGFAARCFAAAGRDARGDGFVLAGSFPRFPMKVA